MTISNLVRVAMLVATLTFLNGNPAWATEGEDYSGELVGYGGFQHIPGSAKGHAGGAIGRIPSDG